MTPPNEPDIKIAALVLAAGSSRRFGSDKRAYSLAGQTLLEHALEKTLALKLPTYLVLSDKDQGKAVSLVGKHAHHYLINTVYASDAEKGMGNSLATGISTVLTSTDVDAVFVVLADMPYLKTAIYQEIIQCFQPGKIVVPYFIRNNKAQQGHPVLFSKKWFKDLQRLSGDKGAKQMITDNPKAIIAINIEDESILQDIDHPVEKT